MKTFQQTVTMNNVDQLNVSQLNSISPQIGFMFGPVEALKSKTLIDKLKGMKGVQWAGCSTAGEITANGVSDNTVTLTCLHLDNPSSRFKIGTAMVNGMDGSESCGVTLGKLLNAPDLTSIIVLSPGHAVNGSALVHGIASQVPKSVIITGGLAGDGGKFEETFTFSQEGVHNNQVIGVGIYGSTLELKHACLGGWAPFGKVRKVTKSQGNVLFELDGEIALNVYEKYLGDQAKDLPGSGLRFPFALLDNAQAETGLIRTLLGIDREKGSLTFAGDIPQNSMVRLMHADSAGLVSAAERAAKSITSLTSSKPTMALAVSCIGRKIVMGVNVDDEIDAITGVFGPQCALAGFYSYGEISPFIGEVACNLHNQTMTLSYLTEK